MQTITPHLWFDKEAKKAAELYTYIFKDSQIKNTATLHNTPSGTADLLSIELLGQEFKLINAGPYFKFTPAVSFLVACDTKDEVDSLWNGLSKDGTALMKLGEYPFSERYGWTQDRYGLSWQVMFMGDRAINQRITPTLMFVGEQCGKAEDAINFYTSVFRNAKVDHVLRYGKDEKPDTKRVDHREHERRAAMRRRDDDGFADDFAAARAILRAFRIVLAIAQTLLRRFGRM